jgi:translation initiation factor eIF-2B subunit delta
MSTEAEGSVPAPQTTENNDVKTEKKEQAQPQKPKEQQQAAPVGEKKLSGAELKKKAKEEKAARRAQAKASQASQGPSQGGQQASGDGKGGKAKPKQDGQHQHQQHGGAKLPIRPAAATAVVKDDKPSIPDCFSHLSMARRIEMTNADKDVHPAVLVLGEHMSAFAISDSVTRLEATLYAFQKVRNSAPVM